MPSGDYTWDQMPEELALQLHAFAEDPSDKNAGELSDWLLNEMKQCAATRRRTCLFDTTALIFRYPALSSAAHIFRRRTSMATNEIHMYEDGVVAIEFQHACIVRDKRKT